MSKGPVRFTSQWVLIGVIMFYTLGTTMIARHTKQIFKPASAGGSEHIQYVQYSYAGISESLNQPETVSDEQQRQNSIAGLTYWDADGSNLTLYDVDFGNEQQFYRDKDDNTNTEQDTDKKEEKKDTHQELTKIQTKLKCVETILKKAVIEPYYVNGQIEGLKINGLEKISQAKTLLLKSGDVILAVNGQVLNSKKEAYDIFIKARKEPIMIIDLLQDGQAKKYLLDFQ
jgi:hypothetical protein